MSPDRSEHVSSSGGPDERPARRRRARAAPPPRFLVFNQRDQPVELHTSSGVVMVAPHTQVELSEAELDAPQVRTMRQRRELSVRPAQAAADDEPDED